MVHQTNSAKEARSTNTEHSPRHIDHRIIATSRGKDPQVECPLDSLKWQLKMHQNKNKNKNKKFFKWEGGGGFFFFLGPKEGMLVTKCLCAPFIKCSYFYVFIFLTKYFTHMRFQTFFLPFLRKTFYI